MAESIREYLEYIEKADALIKNKCVEVYQLRCLATSITAPTDAESIQTSGVTDRVGNIVPKIVMLEKEINQMIDEFVDEKAKRINLIEKLESTVEYDVVHKHYVQYKKLTEIAIEKGYAYQSIVEIHGKALNHLSKHMETYV
jgi:hypothetical protein